MAELQFAQPHSESDREKKINKKVESKIEKQYLFADEAEKQRQEKQYLRNNAFENMKNILENDDVDIRFSEIIKNIHKACFGDLLNEGASMSTQTKAEVKSETKDSIYDILSENVIHELIAKGVVDAEEISKQNAYNNKNEKISGREEISSHVMYRVLMATEIDDKTYEKNRAFVYDERDLKAEGILKKFAQVSDELELFDLENKLSKDKRVVDGRDSVSKFTH